MIANIAFIILILVGVAVVYWATDQLGTPQPLNNIIKVGVVAVAIILVVVLFMQMLGISIPLGIHTPGA